MLGSAVENLGSWLGGIRVRLRSVILCIFQHRGTPKRHQNAKLLMVGTAERAPLSPGTSFCACRTKVLLSTLRCPESFVIQASATLKPFGTESSIPCSQRGTVEASQLPRLQRDTAAKRPMDCAVGGKSCGVQGLWVRGFFGSRRVET